MLKRLLLLTPFVIFSACLEESSEELDKKAFTRIYDHSEFHSSFYAIDMKQTTDGGFLILAGKTEVVREDGETQNVNSAWKGYVLKTDVFGNMVSATEIEEPYQYPVGKLNKVGESYYFFCADVGLNTHLIGVNEQAQITQRATVTFQSNAVPMPLTSNVNLSGDGLLLLSYDNTSSESQVSQVSLTGNVTASTRFYTGDESPVDDLVYNHIIHEGQQFPFTVGQVSANTFFFNGFFNYTFSLVFTSMSENGEYSKLISGHQNNAGFSSVIPVSNSLFAVSSFSFGFNFLSPNVTINTNDPGNPDDVTSIQQNAYSFPELENNAYVTVIRAVLNERNVIVYGSNTKSRQIGLYVYDEATGEFLGSKYLGYSNPFEVGALVQTPEGDLVVSGTTYIAGRLARLCLIKVPQDDILN